MSCSSGEFLMVCRLANFSCLILGVSSEGVVWLLVFCMFPIVNVIRFNISNLIELSLYSFLIRVTLILFAIICNLPSHS